MTDLSRTSQLWNVRSRRSGSPGNVTNLHMSSMDRGVRVANVAYRNDAVAGLSANET